MSFQRLTAAAGLFAALLTNASAFAAAPSPQMSIACVADALQALLASPLIDNSAAFSPPAFDDPALAAAAEAAQAAPAVNDDPRKVLAAFAMNLRDIRYRRGGRVPSTGFDCSGFVHYVFAHALNIDLPTNSASQFRSGVKIARGQMQAGDLVFFHMHGKRISHVGIYLGDGRFIHSPTTGERVRVDELDKAYWVRRFAGAKRPDELT
jgi:cell wall-associated NlpC family hydrolase